MVNRHLPQLRPIERWSTSSPTAADGAMVGGQLADRRPIERWSADSWQTGGRASLVSDAIVRDGTQ
jgi:hypothetical protein